MEAIKDFCEENSIVCIIVAIVVLYYTGCLDSFIGKEPFSLGGLLGGENNMTEIKAAEPGKQSSPQAVSDLGRTPASCYPQQQLKPEDLLPTDENKAIQEFNISKPVGEGILQGVNLLDYSYHVGTNTIGQSLRNANRQLRSEPPNPQVNITPFNNSTIAPDLPRKPLEVGESCPLSSSQAQGTSMMGGSPVPSSA
jgi:hypothetical protein